MANISGTVMSTGQTMGLPAGTYPLSALLGTNTSFLRWDATGYISVGNRTKLNVDGIPTVFAYDALNQLSHFRQVLVRLFGSEEDRQGPSPLTRLEKNKNFASN
jgi:hypothetical protein